MKIDRNWGQIVAQVQHSGQSFLQKQKYQQRQRYLLLRKQNKDQIDYQHNIKLQQQKKKSSQRQYIQSLDKLAYDKQKQLKQRARNKQLICQYQNMKLIRQRQKNKSYNLSINKAFSQLYQQNPLTAQILHKQAQRKQKTKQVHKQFSAINRQIIQLKHLNNNKKIKQYNHFQDSLTSNLNDNKYYKIKDQLGFNKYPYHDNGTSRQKIQNFKTQPDTLEKQYDQFLQHQLFQQINKNQVYKNNMKIKADDQISDQNIFKINLNAQKQSSSPAYLGRLPYNYDRQKQLQCIDKTIRRQTRIKSQLPYFQKYQHNYKSNHDSQIKYQTNHQNPQYISNDTFPVAPAPLSSSPYCRDTLGDPVPQKIQLPQIRPQKTYKQLNIITGKPILRNEYELQNYCFA